MKKLPKEIEDVLSAYGFYERSFAVHKQDGEYYVELEQHTPAGEDWIITIWFDETKDDFIGKINDYSDEFDVDEEAAFFIANRGNHGIPESVRVILEDQEWKEKTLNDMSYELVEFLSN